MEIDFQRLLLKLRYLLNINNDAEMAKALGLKTAGSLRERRRRNHVPIEKIKLLCNKHGWEFDDVVADCRPGAIPFKKGPAKNVAAVDKLLYIIKNGTENERLLIIGRLSEMSESIKFRKKMETES